MHGTIIYTMAIVPTKRLCKYEHPQFRNCNGTLTLKLQSVRGKSSSVNRAYV